MKLHECDLKGPPHLWCPCLVGGKWIFKCSAPLILFRFPFFLASHSFLPHMDSLVPLAPLTPNWACLEIWFKIYIEVIVFVDISQFCWSVPIFAPAPAASIMQPSSLFFSIDGSWSMEVISSIRIDTLTLVLLLGTVCIAAHDTSHPTFNQHMRFPE